MTITGRLYRLKSRRLSWKGQQRQSVASLHSTRQYLAQVLRETSLPTNIRWGRKKQCFSRSTRVDFYLKCFLKYFFPRASSLLRASFYELKLSVARRAKRGSRVHVYGVRAGLNCRRNQRTEAKAAARFPPLMPAAFVCACLEAAAYVGRDKCIRHIEVLPFVPYAITTSDYALKILDSHLSKSAPFIRVFARKLTEDPDCRIASS